MRNYRSYLLIVSLGICVLFNGLVIADERDVSTDSIEVIIQGKQYKSIREYKRQQIKNTLKRSLSSHNLMDFSEDELYEIMKEVRKNQSGSRKFFGKGRNSAKQKEDSSLSDLQLDEVEEQDSGVSQMQEMLRKYQREHKGESPVYIDPDKVKSVLIKPKK